MTQALSTPTNNIRAFRCLQFLALALFILPAKQVFSQPPLDSIQSIIDQEVSNKRSKGIIVGIVTSNGSQFISTGWKDDISQQKPDENTLFEIGSIGKLFTALTMAEMSLRNELNYNDPISKYLPSSLKTPTKNGQEIALLHLSTHRAGLPRTPYNLNPKNLDDPFADYTTEQLYKYISTTELTRDVNAKWQYSNIGYGLLGHILTLVAQKDYASLVNEKICSPLNMKNTGVFISQNDYPNQASGHAAYGKPVPGWTGGLQTLAGAGALRSTANDLLTFASAYLGFIPSDLKPAMDLSLVNQGKKDGNDGFVTMGWTIMSEDHQHIYWKDGGTSGFRTFIGIDKEKGYGLVILSNTDNPVTDIGLHLMDNTNDLKPYHYTWNLVDTLLHKIDTKGIDDAITSYHDLKNRKNDNFVFDPMQLHNLGHELRKQNRIKEALKIFELNALEYPNELGVYENLAELHKRNGEKEKAIFYFEKLKAMDPQNPKWAYLLDEIK